MDNENLWERNTRSQTPMPEPQLDLRNSGKIRQMPMHEGRTVRCWVGFSCGRFRMSGGCPSRGGAAPRVTGVVPFCEEAVPDD
jgi:hypothetical protein